LKRIWAFAVVPGALTGALPPVIGWTAAGGNFLDPQVLALSFFFLIWQMPHFWLMLFMFGAEYEKAGLPSLTRRFSKRQLTSLSFIWMLATATSSLLLPFYFVTSSPAVSLGLVVGGFWFAWEAWKLMRDKGRNQRYTMAFRSINLYAVCVMVLLIVDVMM
jgi:protoheme IX farnesyltransferase